MGTFITGRDPNAATWPIISNPASTPYFPADAAVTGAASIIAALAAGTADTSYVQAARTDNYFRLSISPPALPTGARVISRYMTVRAALAPGNTIWKVFNITQGDSSKGFYADTPGALASKSIQSTIASYNTPSAISNSAGFLVSQLDFSTELITFGLSTSYGNNLSAGCRVYQAYLNTTYDMAPTANITYPASGGVVISDSSSPTIVWDYFDDFQPQAGYDIAIYDLSVTPHPAIYGPIHVYSSETSHQVSSIIPNGSYQVQVNVYQAWTATLKPFPILSPTFQNFTLNVPPLPTPRITAAQIGAHVEVTVFPDINLLNQDTSSFDRGVLSWQITSGLTTAKNTSTFFAGSASLAATMTATTGYLQGNIGAPPVLPGQIFKSASLINPLALTGKQARMCIDWYNSAGAFLSESAGAYMTLAANTWNSVEASNLTAPASAASASVRIQFNTVTSGNIFFIDNAGLWFEAGTTTIPTWGRGGFYEETINLLQYGESTMEAANVWQADYTGVNSLSLVTTSALQSIQGTSSLKLMKAAGATATISASLGNRNFKPCVAGSTLQLNGWSFSTTARTMQYTWTWFKADFTPSSVAAFSTTGTTPTVNTWGEASATLTVPSDAAYYIFSVGVLGVTTTTEQHFFDALVLYSGTSIPSGQYWQGYYPNSVAAPTLKLQFSDDGGVTWGNYYWFFTILNPNTDRYIAEDYSVKSGVSRMYRAFMDSTENAGYVASPLATTAAIPVSFAGVWLQTDADPAGSSYNFTYDGGGRSRTIGAAPALTQVEGRAYPIAQFGTQNNGSVAISIHLDTSADIAAMERFSGYKSLVVFRDSRGRSYRGVMGDVAFTDNPANNSQEASFTLQLAGDQP